MKPASPAARIVAIDALRGLVILLMLVDHAREYFFLRHQVADPMAIPGTAPGLFATRLLAHVCAPVFVALTGLSAWLYGQARGGRGAASAFLLKRGLFLVLLEVTVVSFAWTFAFPPPILYLQVIWVIGLSMVALAGLLWLPRGLLVAVGLTIVFGHNLLDPVAIAPGQPGHAAWSVLHDRGLIALPFGLTARTSYPLLPWIGVIALGYAAGPWFSRLSGNERRVRLLTFGIGALALFVLLRFANVYGEAPWAPGADGAETLMRMLNVTKYPPSLAFLLLTLGTGTLLLVLLERLPARPVGLLAVFGAAPLFFYILHLYALHILSRAGGAMQGTASGLAELPTVGAVWLVAAAVAVPCWFACRWFAARKRTSRRWWMRYL